MRSPAASLARNGKCPGERRIIDFREAWRARPKAENSSLRAALNFSLESGANRGCHNRIRPRLGTAPKRRIPARRGTNMKNRRFGTGPEAGMALVPALSQALTEQTAI